MSHEANRRRRRRRTRRDPKYDVLFEPIEIGPKTLRNRFYQAPHCSHFGVDFPGSQAGLRAMKAEGGWAMVNTEYCSVHPESDDYPNNFCRLWDDSDVRNLAAMCDQVHEQDALAGVELWYGAAHAANRETRLPARGVSQLNSDEVLSQSCYEMSKAEIRELQGFYVAAADRARSAGFDAVNVYGGHFHSIPHQFLDPFYNKRTDEYGGSFENRARFWLETIEMVREEVGDDCAVIVRFGIDALRDGLPGITVDEEGVGFVELADHLVDCWDLLVGNIVGWHYDTAPSRTHGENFQAEWVRRIRPHTSKPIIGVGRFLSPDLMVEAIESGQLDIIGAARPSISDPFLPKKIEEGRLEDIRECIGCNICIATVWGNGSRLICTQNATVGEEFRRGWHPERFKPAANGDNDVLVIGAGPSGLECARVLAERGMRRIHLVDAADEVGGAMRWIPRLPGLGQWERVVGWRTAQLAQFKNVEVITEVRLTPDEVLEYGAEIVVVATGSKWSRDGLNPVTHAAIPGADANRPEILTPDQIMAEGKPVPGDEVLIYDCDGYFMGPSLAERLALEGKKVSILSPEAEIAAFTHSTGEASGLYRRLLDLGVELVPHHAIERIDGRAVLATHAYSGAERTWEADGVVLVTQRISDTALFRGLESMDAALDREGVTGLFRIGDCVQPRLVADAVFDGHRLAREIDTDDPSVPLPVHRERWQVETVASTWAVG